MVAKPNKTKASLPITRHPLFPVMVGLWFAALFGLGSLAIRPALIEKSVLALRIDLVVPAAAPPLGLTARILLALVLFVVGGAIGIVLARRIAKGKKAPVAMRTVVPKAPPAYAEVADDEDFERLAASRNASSNAIPGRRRALAMDEDYSADYHDVAPIPGGAPQILDLADLGPMDEADFADEAAFPELASVPQVQDSFAAPPRATQFEARVEASVEEPAETSAYIPIPVAEPKPEPAVSFDPWNRHVPVPEPVDVANDSENEPVRFAAPASFVASPTLVDRPFGAPSSEVQLTEAAFASEPATFAEPHAIAVESAFTSEPDFSGPNWDDQQACTPKLPPLDAIRLGQLPPEAAADLRSVAVESLGVVQLAERLAMAIARRREAACAVATTMTEPVVPPVVTPPPLPRPGPFMGLAPTLEDIPSAPVFAAPAAEAPTQPTEEIVAPAETAPRLMPAALRPLSFDDADEPLDLVLPPRNFASPSALVAEPVGAEPARFAEIAPDSDDTEEDDAYGSLLGINSAPRSPFVRIDEPEEDFSAIEPVVIFPGQAAQPAPFAAPGTQFAAPSAVTGPVAVPAQAEAAHRFDIPPVPAAPASSQPVAAEETERALKAALATLQRMSGAA